MDDVLSELRNTYNNYVARRDAAQAKIDALDELKGVLEEKKLEIELGKTEALSNIAYGYTRFSQSFGICVGDIQGSCHPDYPDNSYSALTDYYNSLDALLDQVNLDLADQRAEKLADIGYIDDALAAIDAYWTAYWNEHN
jgi:hypothetical protein